MQAVSNILRNALSPEFRRQTKRVLRRFSSARLGRPLELDEFRNLLERQLGVRKGASVLVHCSFGHLKARFSPQDAIAVLKELVGENGNILMPCYPGNGQEWLASGKVFDIRTTPIATGILAQEFAQADDVATSIHPIKAVAAWGRDQKFLIGEHALSRTPYDLHSPYAKLLGLGNSMVIGLGTAKMSFFHCCEDSVDWYAEPLYTPSTMTGHYKSGNGKVMELPTYVHRTEVLRRMESSVAFLTRTKCPDYACFSYRRRTFYTGSVHSIYQHIREQIANQRQRVS